MIAQAWLLTALLATSPFANLLPGETAFTLGFGPFTTQLEPMADPPRLEDGWLVLPAPGRTNGPRLLLAATPPLRAGADYTFACRVTGRGQPRVELRADNGQGHVPVGRFAPGETWTDIQLTFTAQENGAPEGLTYAFSLTPLPHPGAAGEVWVDDLRLVFGGLAREVAPPDLAVDVVGSIHGPQSPVRPGESLRIGALGADVLEVQATIEAPDGRPLVGPVRWSGPGVRELALEGLAPGWYRAVATASDGVREAVTKRDIWLLPDRQFDESAPGPFAFDAAALPRAAEARALGYREVRVVVPWAQMADDRGEPDFDALADRLAPAIRHRLEVVLAVQMTPAGALPRPFVTARRMDSHGFAKGTPLPDMADFEAFATALGIWGRGRGLVYELDHEPFRNWHGEDYTQYLRRFVADLRQGDPTARVAGVGEGFTVSDGAHRAAFLDEVAKRGGLGEISRLSVNLPDAIGSVPEDAMGVGVAALTAALLPGLPSPPPAIQILRPGVVAVDDEDPDTLSGEQLAARLVRDWLAVWPLAPALFETGWRGGVGPREAALEVWQSRYAAVRFVHRRELGDGLHAVFGQAPDGLGMVAIWDATDPRRSSDAPRLDGDGVELVIPATGGVLLRARSLYGRELLEAYGGGLVTLTPGFAPLYLESASVALLDRLLAAATVRRHQAVTVAVWPALEDGRPGFMLRFENHSPAPAAGDVKLLADGQWAPAVERTRYRLPGFGATSRFVPAARWGPAPGRLKWLAEAGDTLIGRERLLLALPVNHHPPPVIDGVDDDWEPAPVWTLDGAERHVAGTDRIGPDDVSATVRARVDARGLQIFAEVRDDTLAANPGDVFANADGLELRLDLDLAGDPAETLPSPDDYTLVLAPYVDDVFQGRDKLSRGPGSGPDLIRANGQQTRFRRRTDGWSVEATLPLTDAGRERIAAAGAFGLDFLLRDVDPGQATVALALSGTDSRDPTQWALVYQMTDTAWQPADTEVEQPAAEPVLLRLGFDPSDTDERFYLDHAADSRVRVMPTHDFIRGQFGLQVEQGGVGDGSPFLSFDLPAGEARELQVWARGSGPDPEHRVGLRVTLGEAEREADLPTEWRRFSFAIPKGVGHAHVAALGPGRIEVAEVTVQAVELPAPEPAGGGRVALR